MVHRTEGDCALVVASETADHPFAPALRRDTRLQRAEESDLKRRVTNYLWTQSVPALRWLVVEADGQSVTLHGIVRTFYEKQLAVHCCQRVAGVGQVVDAIAVQGSTSGRGETT